MANIKYRKVQSHNKDQVIGLYLEGLSMRQVSQLTGISKTKVSDILHKAPADIQIFPRHNLRLHLNENGIPLREYADLIRAENIIIKDGVQPGKIISMIREIITLCFKIGLDPRTLVSFFANFRQFVVSLAREFPGHLESSLDSELKSLEANVNELDMILARCRQLISAIDLIEKMACIPNVYVTKNIYCETVRSPELSIL